MPYTLEYLEDEGIVFTDYIPPLGPADLAEIVTANLQVAAERGALSFLGDLRAMPPGGALVDVYELGAMFDRLGVDRRMREALVVKMDPKADRNMEFFVTVTSNRGIVVRLFAEIDEAKQWLKDERAAQQAE
jgi:hypothetical protein